MAAPVLEQAVDAVAVLAQVHALLGSVSTGDYASLGSKDQREAASSLARLKARVTAHELAAVAAVERSGAACRQGATSTGSLLARDFGGDRREADARVRQAKKVEATPVSHQAMADGIITPRQARVIGDALDLLPESVEPDVRRACEAQLVDHAQRFDLPTFRRRADRVVGSFMVASDDTDALDAAESQIVEDREKRAWAKAEFWMAPADRDGAVKGGFVLPEAQAAMLKTAMDTLMAPQVDIVAPGDVRRTTLESTRLLDEKPTYTRRLGWAFAHLCELLPTDELPTTNNTGIVLTVSIDEDSLRDRLKAATLSTGDRISAGEARRLACDYGILPAVLGGASLPLDLGRTKRLFTTHQRTALGLRDQGCVFPGCDRPPGMEPPHKARSGGGVSGAPRQRPLGRRRHHRPQRRGPALPTPPPGRPCRRVAGPIRRWDTRARPTPSTRPQTTTTQARPIRTHHHMTAGELCPQHLRDIVHTSDLGSAAMMNRRSPPSPAL